VKHILGRHQRAVLEALARTRTLLAFDFDGTLAPLVSEPGLARLRLRTRSLLAEAARLYKCAVITGRALSDLRPRVAGLPLWAALGNHGAEGDTGGHRRAGARRTVRDWRRILRHRLRPTRGVFVEDKRETLTIHFRSAASRPRARRAVLRIARALPHARLVAGHYGINLLPVGSPDKGTAVLRLRRRARSEAALYVGDDGSDELVFSSGRGRGLVTVRVGRSRASRAAYYLRDQGEIDDLLARLVALRGERPAARDGRVSSAGARRR
jgi:trehalose 6-phosphate phosphatase